MKEEKKKRAPIHITIADIERAYKNVEEFKRLLKRGKTREQIFKDMLRLIEVDK
jgi:hypothetical protein